LKPLPSPIVHLFNKQSLSGADSMPGPVLDTKTAVPVYGGQTPENPEKNPSRIGNEDPGTDVEAGF
jgi:hypothetical protein